jgi:hypothetical protein
MRRPVQRIVYLSWPATEISGGIKLCFRHVEVLREAGIDAVVATPGGERPGWFETQTPLIDVSAVRQGEDVLVFPENHHAMLRAFTPWPNAKLVFCQNQFMVFRGLGDCEDYAAFGVSGILCEGCHVAAFCRRRFPKLPIATVSVVVNHDLFHFQREKKLQIAFAPRKRPLEAAFIRDLFRSDHPDLRDIPWIEISGASEGQVAGILRETALYLSLCRFEACPLSILEALASGCVAVGFTGFGAREFTTARNGFWVAEDDCVACADALAQAVRLVKEGGTRYPDMLEAANATAMAYCRERFARHLVAFWRAYRERGSFPDLPLA